MSSRNNFYVAPLFYERDSEYFWTWEKMMKIKVCEQLAINSWTISINVPFCLKNFPQTWHPKGFMPLVVYTISSSTMNGKVREKQSHENKRNDKDYKRFMTCTFEPVLLYSVPMNSLMIVQCRKLLKASPTLGTFVSYHNKRGKSKTLSVWIFHFRTL